MILFLPAKGLPIAVQARLSGRSRSSFYYKPKKPAKDEKLRALIEPIHQAFPFYGSKSIALEISRSKGIKINHKCVYRIMKRYGMCALYKPKKRKNNQYFQGNMSLPNLVKELRIDEPNYVWAGDFTEFKYFRHIYYLATVMDLYTREIIGWHIGTNHSAELVAEALHMAIGRRLKTPLIFHSDHGSEYVSEAFRTKLKEHGISPSHSGKGKPWQNGRKESFYNRFKREFGDPRRFWLFERFFEALAKQIHFYNTRRIHSALKMPPRDFYDLKMKELQEKEAKKTKMLNVSLQK
jgi:putative transposase